MKTLLYFLFAGLTLIACSSDPVSNNTAASKVILEVEYVNQTGFLKPGAGANAIDSIKVTRARFLLRNTKLKSVMEDSIDFKTHPQVIEINLAGTANAITVSDINPGRYHALEFRIHKLDDNDPNDSAAFQDPVFTDFIDDNRYSMIIDGQVFANGTSTTFRFRSRDNAKQRHDFQSLMTIDEDNSTLEVTLVIDGTEWFWDQSGRILDPRESSNEKEISDNLQESIRIRTKVSNRQLDDSNLN